MEAEQPAGSVREGWAAAGKQETETLIQKLTHLIRNENLLGGQPNRIYRLLGTLSAELDLRLRHPANRYSVEKSMASLAALHCHPDIGTDFSSLEDATCMDFGCGGLNPAGGLLTMLLAGAKRGIALDMDDIQSLGCAARTMHAVLGAALSKTCRPRIPGTASQILSRVASFNWDKLANGEISGVDTSRLSYIQQPLANAEIATSSVDILVSNSVLEHIAEPESVIAEMARIMRPGGLCVHAIDGVDHRSYRSAGIDELEFLRNDSEDLLIFGCNRVRPLAFQPMFETHGFEVRGLRTGDPITLTDEVIAGFAPQFRELPREHLEVSRARFYLRRR